MLPWISQYLILLFDYSIAILKNPILEVFTISITKAKTAFLCRELLQTLFLYHSRSYLPSDYGTYSCSSENVKSSEAFEHPQPSLPEVLYVFNQYSYKLNSLRLLKHYRWKITLSVFLCKILEDNSVKVINSNIYFILDRVL